MNQKIPAGEIGRVKLI